VAPIGFTKKYGDKVAKAKRTACEKPQASLDGMSTL
jgi:hypothetical protein